MYGQVIFYDAIKHKAIVAGFDIHRLNWAVRPKCFITAPAQYWRSHTSDILECLGRSVDVVVVDPP